MPGLSNKHNWKELLVVLATAPVPVYLEKHALTILLHQHSGSGM